tara:strand:+ start:61 stop:483 length:423 start_codon:yes stop_codon:yes gene_type:complete
MEHQDRIKFVLDHYKTKVIKDQSSFGKCDFQIYPDYTSDGYKLTVAKYNENILSKDARGIPTINKDPNGSSGKVFLNEHVFHNNYDLSLLFIQELRKGDLSIYIDEEIYEDAMIDNYLEEEYEILVELQEKNDKLYDNFL